MARSSLRFAPVLLLALPLAAQAPLSRPFNLAGVWTADLGVVQFDFVHRFYVSPAPTRKVINFPTFGLATGLARDVMLGAHYGSNSQLVTAQPNELELFARWRLLGGEGTEGLALAVTPAYNTAAKSADAEVAAAYTRGRLSLAGAGRYLAKPLGGAGGDVAIAAGAALRLNDYVAVAGDYATLLGADTTAAWSVGLKLLIPGSPHAFSLHASTAVVNTMQSGSVGFGEILYGFEFTIPLHLKRFAPWFGGEGSAPRAGNPCDGRAADVIVEATDALTFSPADLTITVGQTVCWQNRGTVFHTVTSTDGAGSDDDGTSFNAHLGVGAAFAHTFRQRGSFSYHCVPHLASGMVGTIVVL